LFVAALVKYFIVCVLQLWTSDAQGDEGDPNTAAVAPPNNWWLTIFLCPVVT